MQSKAIPALALFATLCAVVNGQAEGLTPLNRFATLTTVDPAQASTVSGDIVAYISAFAAQSDVAPLVSELASFIHIEPSVYSAAESLFLKNPAEFVSVYLGNVPTSQVPSQFLAIETSLVNGLSSILNKDLPNVAPATGAAPTNTAATATGTTMATAKSGASTKSVASSTGAAASSSDSKSASSSAPASTTTAASISKAGAADAMVTGRAKAIVGAAVAAGAIGMAMI